MESSIASSTAKLGAWRETSQWISVRQETIADDDLNNNNWAKFPAPGS